ncbi:hypothetical protein AMECASPLE_019520 [Ameca splendens]|uniref:Uncharacterized protein n=1 Tax=Ameca splendens TaxID=208324 RepID=A0ABV0ZMU5_9TELE
MPLFLKESCTAVGSTITTTCDDNLPWIRSTTKRLCCFPPRLNIALPQFLLISPKKLVFEAFRRLLRQVEVCSASKKACTQLGRISVSPYYRLNRPSCLAASCAGDDCRAEKKSSSSSEELGRVDSAGCREGSYGYFGILLLAGVYKSRGEST